MFILSKKRIVKAILQAFPLTLLFLIPFIPPVPDQVPSSHTFQPVDSGITWSTQPLRRVFDQIRNKFIGLIPGTYTEPASPDYSTMRRIFTLIHTGISNNDASLVQNASAIATQIDYQVVPLNDSRTGNRYYVLMESANVNRGWGSYLFSALKSPASPEVIIEAPHPVTDFNSEEIAYSIFTNSYPRVTAFLVSGVERTFGPSGETDMAHRTLSVFETAHEVLTSFGSIMIQIHSFSALSHPQSPLVVLSAGDGTLNGALQSIAYNLQSSRFSVGIFDGFRYGRLGAQRNVQGRYARAFGAGFVHAELSSVVVYNATLVSQFESSVTQSIRSGFRFPPYEIDLKIPAIVLGVIGVFFFASFRFSKTKVKL